MGTTFKKINVHTVWGPRLTYSMMLLREEKMTYAQSMFSKL